MGNEKQEARTYARTPPAGHGHSEPEMRPIDPTLHVNEVTEAHSSEPWGAERGAKDGKAKAKMHARHRASRSCIVSPELASDGRRQNSTVRITEWFDHKTEYRVLGGRAGSWAHGIALSPTVFDRVAAQRPRIG